MDRRLPHLRRARTNGDPLCPNIGIACQPKAIICTKRDEEEVNSLTRKRGPGSELDSRFRGTSGASSRRTAPRTPAAAPCRPPASSRLAEIGEAGDAVARVRDAARHDAGEMRQLRIDVERDAVQAHPALQRGCRSRRSCPRARRPCRAARTQTPTRSSRRSPRTLKAASVRMIHSSSVATKRRTSGPRRLRSSIR